MRDELQDIVAAIAEHDRLRRYRELRSKRALERKRIAVGIACQFSRCSRNRSKRLRTGSARILVRRELDDRRWIEIVFTRQFLDRLAWHVTRNLANVFRRERRIFDSGRMTHLRSRLVDHASAAG